MYMFLGGQVSGLVKKFNIWIFSDTMDVVNVKTFCIVVLHIELYLYITLVVTLTLFQCHSSVKQLIGLLSTLSRS